MSENNNLEVWGQSPQPPEANAEPPATGGQRGLEAENCISPLAPIYYATVCKILYSISNQLISFQFDFNFCICANFNSAIL